MLTARRLLTVTITATALALAAPAGADTLPYQDPSLPVAQRVSDLVSRMTLAEKIGQMTQTERYQVYDDPSAITTYGLGSILSGGGSTPTENTPAAWADMVDRFQSAALCSQAAKCAVVVVSGRPLIVDPAQRAEADALVAAWLPGSEGAGVADTLFGVRPFTGKLPMSWPRTLDQEPINKGDANYDPLYRFGFGLTT
jgi:hypothetical protein